jgi:trans-aconitate methyltransferase
MMLASPDVGASEAIDVKNMMWEKDPEAQAQAQELSSQLSEMMGIGIKPQIDQSRSVASIQPPQVVDQPQVESPQPSIIPSINSAKAQLDDQQLTGGNDKELSYQDIIKSQIDGLNNQMSNRSTLSYLDLSPLMQAVDNMTGSKMAQSYRGPKASADNDMAKVSGLAEKLADESARKRQLDIQMQNALKNTADQKLQAAMQLAAFKDSLKGNGLSDKNLSDYRVNFLKDDRTKDIDALNDFNSELQDYLKEIQSVGNSWETLSSDKRAKIESAYNKLVTTVNRDYAKLGALAGADLDILKKIFPEMTGFGGALNRFKGANITNQITNIEDYQTKSKDRASKQFDKLTAAYPKEAIGEDLYNLYNNQLSNMKNPANTSSGRSPTTPVSNMTKSGTKTPTELEAEKILKEMGL